MRFKILVILVFLLVNCGFSQSVFIQQNRKITTYDCDDLAEYQGGVSYPTVIHIIMGSGTGTVTLTYEAFVQPDKFIVIFDGVEVINTGYRGLIDLQDDLNAALATYGDPPEDIVGVGSGDASFNKNTSTTLVTIMIYAPIIFTQWELTLSCPE